MDAILVMLIPQKRMHYFSQENIIGKMYVNYSTIILIKIKMIYQRIVVEMIIVKEKHQNYNKKKNLKIYQNLLIN